MATGLLAAIVLAACGGGSGDGTQAPKYKFTSMVNFGDSLSDVGTYKVPYIASLGGGMFTVNSPTAQNWTQVLAAQLGVSNPCPAQIGLNGTGPFDVPPQYVATCTNYAQGGARVNNLVGPSNYQLDLATKNPPPTYYVGALTVPVTSQIDRHLSVVRQFSGTELVTVMAGANDLFIQLGALDIWNQYYLNNINFNQFTALFTSYVTNFSDWTSDEASNVVNAVSKTDIANAAVGMMVRKMNAVGNQLASTIVTKIKGNGAKFILVLNMPNVSRTPAIQSSGSNAITAVSLMTQAFNDSLKAGLAGQSNIRFGDVYATNTDQLDHPAQYGITNTTNTACAISETIPSSLFCSSATLNAGDVSKYLFADGVHPTPYGYKLFAQEAAKHLVLAGWL